MPDVEDGDEGGSEGGIFEGTKFWLSHRIPSRANIIALIKEHGGLIEAYDKRADILIADHARRDAPPNSFSWRLITESDKAGRFLEKETHRIGRPPTEPRPVASQEPKKSRRVPFSAADDALLASWVSKSKQQSGNKIYQELEAAHPHHTWHSWRDRWLKHVRLLPADILDRMVDSSDLLNEQGSATPAPSGQTTTNRPKSRGQAAPPKTQQPPTVQSPPQALRPSSPQALGPSSPQPLGPSSPQALRPSSPQALRPSSPGERQESPGFSDDDDDLLGRYVKHMVEAGARWNSIAIYETLAKEHPRHSAEAWKQRFAKLWRDNRVDMKNWNSTARSRTHLPSSRPSTNSEERQRGGNGRRADGNALSDQDDMSSSQKSTPGAVGQKELFYRRYRAWINLEARQGRTKEVMIWHRIQGRKLELWNLYEAILGQECSVDDVEWERVARKIGFGGTTLMHASEELEGCWDKYLAKYHNDTIGFDFTGMTDSDDSGEPTEGTDDTSGEEDASEEEPGAEEEGVSRGEDVPTTQSVELSPSLSRSRPGDLHRKRRPGRGVEIPASPVLKAKSGPLHGANDATPSKRRRLSSRTEGLRPEADSDEDEDNHERPTRKDANHPSPLSVRSRPHRGSGTPASNAAREQPGRASGTSGSMSTGEHSRRSTATPGPSTARGNIRNTSAAPRGTSSSRSAPKRRALPPAMAPEPEPGPEATVDDNYTEEEEAEEDEVQATVEQFVQEGYTRDMTIESLYRTSMVPSLSREVVASLARGDGVPEDQAGVWTAADDDKLRSVEAGVIDRPTENISEQRRKRELVKVLEALVGKHGKDNVQARRRFLVDAKQVGFSL